jgi:hypothetical protein
MGNLSGVRLLILGLRRRGHQRCYQCKHRYGQ